MKKTFKKSLAFLLSALMIASMIPAFGITALANDALNAQAFLTSKETFENGITNNGATWDDNMNAAYFNGSSSVKLNSRPLQNVTQTSGFIVSMDVYNVNNELANKYFNFTNGSQFYGCEGSSPDWWTRYRSQISNGTNTRWYYTSDLNKAEYTSVTSEKNGNESYNTYEWYTFTLVMNPDGSYSYYRNCELLGTYISDYISTGNGGGLTNESAASVIAGLTDYYIGAADGNGAEGFTGYIRNVRFYDKADSASLLDLAVSEYENKMDGTIYKNISPAYNAYVAANKALDSYVYGGSASTVTDADLATAASNLVSATNNMTVWEEYSATQNVAMGSNSVDNSSNVLYASSDVTFSEYIGLGSTKFKTITNNKVVLYYNGNDSKTYFPVGIEVVRDGNDKRQYDYVYFSQSVEDHDGQPTGGAPDTKIELRANWRGYQDGWNGGIDWAQMWTNGSDCFGYYQYDLGHNFVIDSTRYYGNLAYYKATAPTSGNPYPDNSLSKVGLIYEVYNVQRNHCAGYNAGTEIYVIDYYQVTQRIKDNIGYFSNVADYSQGGLSSLASALDTATAFDLGTYANSASAYTDATNVINNTVIPAFSGASATADSGYAALRTAITNYKSVNNDDDKYTAASFSAFTTAYNNAVNHMAGVVTEGYNSSAANSLASELNTAYANLAEKGAENTYNLTLDDKIKVNFNIDTEFYGAQGGTIEVEYVKTTDENGVITVGKDTVEYPAATEGKTPLTLDVAPAQIAEPYVITVKDSQGGEVETITTSIADYCAAIIGGEFDAKEKEVARGLLDYGASAEVYFNYREKTTPGYSVDHSDDYDTYKAGFDAEDFKEKAKCSQVAGVDASGKSVYVTGVSYLALLDPEFRFYVNQTNEVWAAMTEVSIDDPELTAEMVKTANGNCVRVTGLKASDFAKTFTITIGTYELTYNGYAYLYTILRDGGTNDDDLRELATGAYRYAAACEAKFAV